MKSAIRPINVLKISCVAVQFRVFVVEMNDPFSSPIKFKPHDGTIRWELFVRPRNGP